MFRIIFVYFLFISTAYAQTYMCKDGGTVVFQDRPCNSVVSKTDGRLCNKSLNHYESLIQSGGATPAEKMCLSEKRKEKEQQEREAEAARIAAEKRAQEELRLAEEKKRKAEEDRIRAERQKAADEERGKAIARELRAKREAAEKRRKQIQAAKDMGMYFVEYRVLGSALNANIHIEALKGQEQHKVRLNWDWWMRVPAGKILYLSAQNDSDYGDVTAEIWVNGIKVKSATSTADYGVATVSGKL